MRFKGNLKTQLVHNLKMLINAVIHPLLIPCTAALRLKERGAVLEANQLCCGIYVLKVILRIIYVNLRLPISFSDQKEDGTQKICPYPSLKDLLSLSDVECSLCIR